MPLVMTASDDSHNFFDVNAYEQKSFVQKGAFEEGSGVTKSVHFTKRPDEDSVLTGSPRAEGSKMQVRNMTRVSLNKYEPINQNPNTYI